MTLQSSGNDSLTVHQMASADGGRSGSSMDVDCSVGDKQTQVNIVWENSELADIQHNRAYHLTMINYINDLEEQGPFNVGPMPEKPKKGIEVLVNAKLGLLRKKSQVLSGKELHEYLKRHMITPATSTLSCPMVSEANPKNLNDTRHYLKLGFEILSQSNRTNIDISINYGNWLNKAFEFYEVEKEKHDTWKEWISREVGIGDSYARKLRKLAEILGRYHRFKELSISFSELYNHLKQIKIMLTNNGDLAAFWEKSTGSTASRPNTGGGPVGPLAGSVPTVGLIRPPHRNRTNRHKPYNKNRFKKKIHLRR